MERSTKTNFVASSGIRWEENVITYSITFFNMVKEFIFRFAEKENILPTRYKIKIFYDFTAFQLVNT